VLKLVLYLVVRTCFAFYCTSDVLRDSLLLVLLVVLVVIAVAEIIIIIITSHSKWLKQNEVGSLKGISHK